MPRISFSRAFPKSVPIPSLLNALRDFQAIGDQFYSGHFELVSDGKKIALAMLDNDEKAAAEFAVFAQEVDGSAFAYWLYGGRAVDEAPIVYLSSEGTGWTVLANTLEDFMALLAVGADDLGFAAGNTEIARAAEPAPRLDEFRRWLKEEHGVKPAPKPAAVIESARKAHPDLQQWLHRWQQTHFAK